MPIMKLLAPAAKAGKNRYESNWRPVDEDEFNYGGSANGLKNYNAEQVIQQRQLAGREAFQANYDQSTVDRALGRQARTGQSAMANQMAARARGEVPSIAQMQADRQMGQAVAAQNAQRASARGAAGLALAGQGAANNIANVQSSISRDAQINAAQERERAEANAFGAYGGMRQGDQASEQLAAQRAQFNTSMQQANRDANDQYSAHFGNLRARANEAGLNASMQRERLEHDNWNRREDRDAQIAQANAAAAERAYDQAANTSIWDLFSDMNAKEPVDIFGLSQPVQGEEKKSSGMGGMMSGLMGGGGGGGGGGGASMFGFLSDGRAKSKSDGSDVVPLSDHPDGRRLQVGLDGRAFYSSAPDEDDGRPSLSGPTPRYSKAAPSSAPERESSSPKAKPKPKKKAPPRDLMKEADAMMASMRSDHDARMAAGPAVRADDYTISDKRAKEPAKKKTQQEEDDEEIRRFMGEDPGNTRIDVTTPEARDQAQREAKEDQDKIAYQEREAEREVRRAREAEAKRKQEAVKAESEARYQDDRMKVGLGPVGAWIRKQGGFYDPPTTEQAIADQNFRKRFSETKKSVGDFARRYGPGGGQTSQEDIAKRLVPERVLKEFHSMLPQGKVRNPVSFERDPSPLANAARSMEGSSYAYKPGLTPPNQRPGEPNFGPMAQNMEKSPIAGTAVKENQETGLKVIDRDKALKVTMSVAADQQRQLDEMRAELAKKKGEKK